jgi:mRNA interferase HicA
MNSQEAKRYLQSKGATFSPGKGGHLKVYLGDKMTVLPMHGSRKELKKGTWRAILKDLGLK